MLLVDGDILIYQAVSSAEKELEFQPDLWVMTCDHTEAKDTFASSLENILKRAGEDTYHLAVSDPNGNWRKEVYPEYKSNRKKLRKPMGFIQFRQWVIDNYPVVMKPKLEADDVIGILATKPGNDALVWSIDKDFKQIPGRHLTAEGEVVYSEAEADYWHLRQTLTGDAVDGYPGCKGIGPAKADIILESPLAEEKGDWAAIVNAYEKAGLTEEFALTQARVARILRWNDWDAKKQEVKLWNPQLS